jgi:hypothetical protein
VLKICTVYFEGIYTPEYVSNLYRSLKRNSTTPFQFICLTDNENIEADIILPYNHHSEIKKHWHKLKFFSPHFAYQEPGDDIIVMDIDQIIVNNVDELLNFPVEENELIIYGQWWNLKPSEVYNGGFYKFKSGSLKFIWDDFIDGPDFWQLYFYNEGVVHYKYYGEQNYVKWKIEEHNAKLTYTPKEWLAKYSNSVKENAKLNKLYANRCNTDFMIVGDVNENIKVVHFLGVGNTIHNCDADFIKEHWK